MIFIAGSQPKIKTYQAEESEYCFRCHNNSKRMLQKQQQYISLFFIPIVPLKVKYFSYCPICGNTIELNKNEFEKKIQNATPQ